MSLDEFNEYIENNTEPRVYDRGLGQVMSSATTAVKNNRPSALRVASILGFWIGDSGVNLDMGAGKTSKVDEYIEKLGWTNVALDPFNMNGKINMNNIDALIDHGLADTAILSNVINVIDSTSARRDVLFNTAVLCKKGALCIVSVYIGDKEQQSLGGKRNEKLRSHQNFRKMQTYIDDVEALSDYWEIDKMRTHFMILKRK